MDHLPIPRSPIRSHPQIAVATKQSDSPGSFLTYPSRHAALLNGSQSNDETGGGEGTGVSSHDIIDYYQGWLFFALLSEFLGPLFDSEKYIAVAKEEDGEEDSEVGAANLWEEVDEEDEAGQGQDGEDGEDGDADPHPSQTLVLSTKHLHEDLTKWRTEGPLSAITEGDDYHLHLTNCLDAAFAAFDELESTFTGFIEAFPDHFLCLASVAEALDSAVVTAIEEGPVEDIPSCATSFPSPAKRNWLQKISTILDLNNTELPLREPMLQAGWCPADISRMKDSFSSIAASYYFSNFQPSPSTPNLHDDCPPYACTVPHSAPADPAHLNDLSDASCDCPGTITFDEDELIPIYEQPNTIPCFTVGLTDSGGVAAAFTSISLSPEAQQDPENRYVAVSHVWSQGMGNPESNALPFCKLSTIQYWAALARQVVAGREPHESSDHVSDEPETQTVNLWIDTMCVPVTPGRGRNLALARMRDIYANASAVLVKSTEMEETQVEEYVEQPERGVMDLSVRLYLSAWMKRLWTLPEAVLAGMRASPQCMPGSRLVFGFGGGLLPLESVVGLLKQAPKHEAGLARAMIGEFVELTPMLFGFDDDEDEEKASGNYLACLTTALKYRGLSVASDELVCLATLVGVPVRVGEWKFPLVGDATETVEEGMGEVWRVIERKNKGVPGEIIFSSVPRVEVDGFRWAPRTFIQHARYGDVYWSPSDGDDESDGSGREPARITQHGLEVKFSGVRLEVDLSLYGKPLVRKVPGSELKDRAQRVMFMQIPPGGEDWYSIHIHALDGLEDSFENLSLRPSLVELVGSGKVAVILKQSQPEGKGLLVSIKDDSLPSVQVRAEYPVTIGSVSPPTAYICSSVQQNIGRIRAAAKTSEALVKKELSKLMSGEELLRDALVIESLDDSPSEEQLISTFVKTANLVAELGGVGGTMMAAGQSWIVD